MLINHPNTNNNASHLATVSVPNPYPEIRVKEPNQQYVQMLTQDLADLNSELTTIHTYVYQSWVLNSKCPDISSAILRIAMVEMHHLNILGKLILLLGGNPKYQTIVQNRYHVWNGAMINYSQDIKEILQNNIESEQCAYDSYCCQAGIIQDPYLSAILTRISLDEQLHINIFKKYLAELK